MTTTESLSGMVPSGGLADGGLPSEGLCEHKRSLEGAEDNHPQSKERKVDESTSLNEEQQGTFFTLYQFYSPPHVTFII
jgi:hypothetical protein